MSTGSNPKISIITPSYNQGEFIEQTIDSVLSQNYPALEYIIIDGGSSDNTVEIIKKYEQHLAYWVSESDRGQSHAINKGLNHCTGDIFNWINSDDYYEENALWHVARAFEESGCDIYGGTGRIFDTKGTKFYGRGTDVFPDDLAKTIGKARIDQPETFWNLRVLKTLLPINESLHFLMDRDLWIRYLLLHGQDQVERDEELLVHFRHHSHSKTISLGNEFNDERNSYFLQLASFIDRDLSSIHGSIRRTALLPIRFESSLDNEILNRSIDHFLFLLAEEAYAERRMKECSNILTLIPKSTFDGEDKKLLRKISKRSRATKWMTRN